MSNNIMDLIRPFLDKGPLEAISHFVGEDHNGVRRGLEAGIPASVAGLADFASDHNNAASLLDHLRRTESQGSLTDPSSILSNPAQSEDLVRGGDSMLQRVFGANKLNDLVGGISSHAGIGRAGTSKLMAVGMPILLSIIGKHAVSQNMNAGGLSSYLSSQKGLVSSMIPTSLGSFFNRGQTAKPINTDIRDARERAFNDTNNIRRDTGTGVRRVIPWAMAALAAVLGVTLLARMGHRATHRAHESISMSQPRNTPFTQPQPTAQPATPPTAAPNAQQPDAYAGGQQQNTDTTGTLGAAAGNDAAEISRFLASHPNQSQRFEMQDVSFAPGSAALNPQDRQALNDVAQVLARDTSTDIRVEGHTDTTGDSAMNQRLSQLRAEAVENYLVSRNVGQDRIEAVGVGEEPTQSGEPQRSVALVLKPH